MFGITPLKPGYGRDYRNMKDVEKDFNAGKDFVTASGQLINKEQIKELGLKSVEIRYSKLMKVTVIKLK